MSASDGSELHDAHATRHPGRAEDRLEFADGETGEGDAVRSVDGESESFASRRGFLLGDVEEDRGAMCVDGEALGGSLEEEVADDHAGGLALVHGGGDVDGEAPAVARARLGGERARGPLHQHLVASEALDLQGGAHLDARHLHLARGFRVRGGELDDVVVGRGEVARHAISNAHETVGGGADVLRDRTPPSPAPASSVRDRHVERLAGVLRPERRGERHLRALLEHVPGLGGRDSHHDRGAGRPPDEGDAARPLARRDVNFERGSA